MEEEEEGETHAIDFDDLHLVSVDLEEEHGERARVDDPDPVRSAGRERQRGVFVEAGEVLALLVDKVDQSRICPDELEGLRRAFQEGREEGSDGPGTGSAPPGLALDMNRFTRDWCSSWYQSPSTICIQIRLISAHLRNSPGQEEK